MLSRSQITVFISMLVFTSVSRAQFDTVINVPPDSPHRPNGPFRPESILINSNTQLNLFDDGRLFGFEAGRPDGSSTNVEVNLFGGAGGGFRAYAGSEVNVFGGYPGDFSANGGEVNMFGGEIQELSNAGGGQVNVFGGHGESVAATTGGEVNILGGTLGYLRAGVHPNLAVRIGESRAWVSIIGGAVNELLLARAGSEVVIDGGAVHDVLALSGSTITVSGGTIAHGLIAERGSRVILAGGGLPSRTSTARTGGLPLPISGVRFEEGSELTILGSDFRYDGASVEELTNPGDAIPFDPVLAGNLPDGTPFAIPAFGGQFDMSTLTLEVVSRLEGDYNNNGTVEQGDLDFVLMNWGERLFNPYDAGWINDMPSGVVDQGELDGVLLNWGASVERLAGEAVPEPVSATLACVMIFLVAWRRRRL